MEKNKKLIKFRSRQLLLSTKIFVCLLSNIFVAALNYLCVCFKIFVCLLSNISVAALKYVLTNGSLCRRIEVAALHWIFVAPINFYHISRLSMTLLIYVEATSQPELQDYLFTDLVPIKKIQRRKGNPLKWGQY